MWISGLLLTGYKRFPFRYNSSIQREPILDHFTVYTYVLYMQNAPGAFKHIRIHA